MTTSTKRPDGGELKARIWDGYGCPDCKGTGENLANPINAGLCQTCSGTGSRTPTNESPAPQAPQFLPCEDGEFNGPAFAGECCSAISPCAHQRKSPDTICETCRLATARPAPQPPVEGLREALRAKINEMNILVREYDTSNPDWAFRSGVMLTVLTKMCRDLDALTSPSLTAGVENPDIGPETGNPEVDGLIHRLLDAQQDINFAANTHMDQSLCNAAALIDDVERYLRKYASAAPATLIEQSGQK